MQNQYRTQCNSTPITYLRRILIKTKHGMAGLGATPMFTCGGPLPASVRS